MTTIAWNFPCNVSLSEQMGRGVLGDGDTICLAATVETVGAALLMAGQHGTEEQAFIAAEALVAGLCKLGPAATVSCSISIP